MKSRRNTKSEILEAAIELYAQRGISAVSVRDITSAVGIKESALYNHFESKFELLDAILNKYKFEFGLVVFSTENLEERIEKTSPEEFLKGVIANLLKNLVSDARNMWKIVYMEMLRDERAGKFAVNEVFAITTNFFKESFRIMMEKGKLRKGDYNIASKLVSNAIIFASIEGLLLVNGELDTGTLVESLYLQINFICNNLT